MPCKTMWRKRSVRHGPKTRRGIADAASAVLCFFKRLDMREATQALKLRLAAPDDERARTRCFRRPEAVEGFFALFFLVLYVLFCLLLLVKLGTSIRFQAVMDLLGASSPFLAGYVLYFGLVWLAICFTRRS